MTTRMARIDEPVLRGRGGAFDTATGKIVSAGVVVDDHRSEAGRVSTLTT